ncbi:two-component system chemotaxis sensor kinase CheA [Paraperlucidibaca baekdonensis]|uniref:Chemotaxis protein CheA n=2 Tax=Paraperlucidibaca baekdonensis TaxID=748120 RepID=A0A3E0H0X9_9GAMM|nr:two-component system chemotaxis sensor kinase CheA [Paraperlucidibaca baekdonensis]
MTIDMDMSEFHAIFFEEASEHLASLETLLVGFDREQPDPEAMNAIFRAAHSIKGSASTFGFPDMAAVTHDLETLLDKARKGELQLTEEMVDITLEARDVLLLQLAAHQGGEAVEQAVIDDLCARVRALAVVSEPAVAAPTEADETSVEAASDAVVDAPDQAVPEPAAVDKAVAAPPETPDKPKAVAKVAESSSIRVSVEKVDQLINLVGELVITQSMLALTEQSPLNDGSAEAERLLERLQQLERNTRELQETVMSIRMLPVSAVFNRFPRLVRDLAGKLDKQIELRTFGESTELDRGVIEKITDPLTHLIRNSVDHGIELPDERTAAGKPAKGVLTLSAYHQGGSVIIQIQDDGKGFDRDRILAKARERNLPLSDNPGDQEIWNLIFAPGFSTADTVTDVSGRGVGMDVVRRNIENLGGRVDLQSVQGQGTTITIRLPLTLAIMDGMAVGIGEHNYIVPLTAIIESLRPIAKDLKGLVGHDGSKGRLVLVRGEYLPLVALHEVFNIEPKNAEPEKGILIIVDTDSGRAALFVDELQGQRQVVIKSLESNYRKVPGISAATIMGDGSVSMILDVSEAVRLGRRHGMAAVTMAQAV